jgi:hypothetical protein
LEPYDLVIESALWAWDEVASSNLASSSIKKPGNSRVSGLSSFLYSMAAIIETETETETEN